MLLYQKQNIGNSQQAKAYQKLTKRFFEFVIQAPVEEVVEDFRKSSYFKTKK